MTRLLSIFQIRAGEARMVFLVAALFACVQASQGIGWNAADALFFLRFGVNYLPYLFMILGAATFLLTLLYATGLGRIDSSIYFSAVLLAAVVALLVERAAIFLNLPILYPILWLTVNIINTILGTLIWTVAGQVCDTRQAKRLFSLFASGGILGGITGNLITGPLAHAIQTENLLFLCSILLLIALVLARLIARGYLRNSSRRAGKGSLWDEIRTGYNMTRESRLIRYMFYASILFSVLFFSMSFPFSRVVSQSFSSEAQVAGFLGVFSSVMTAATFVTSLLVANRLYGLIGIAGSVLLLPITYLGGFVLWTLNFSLTTAVIARLAQMVVLSGIASTAWWAFFNVIPPRKREDVQAFETGVPSQIGVVLSGAMLIMGERLSNTDLLFWVGIITALVTGYLILHMRRDYAESLVEALRAGLLDVFTGSQKGFQTLGADASARQAALGGLVDSKPAVRRAAAEILGRLGAREAVGPLTSALGDSDAEVRGAALDALEQLDAREAHPSIAACLDDPDPGVRAGAVRTMATLVPHLSDRFFPLLDDPHPAVRARAVIALHRAGEEDKAHETLTRLLQSDDPQFRVQGLEALAHVPDGTDPGRIAEFLEDDAVGVRLAAVQALETRTDSTAQAALARALDDADSRVRHAAARALSQADQTLGLLTDKLNNGSPQAQEAALLGLGARGPAARDALVAWSLVQIPEASRLQRWAVTLGRPTDQESTALGFLRDLLHEREWAIEQRILNALAAVGTEDAIRLIGRGLKSADRETRAHALEALDTLGDRRIARALLPLLEEKPPGNAGDPQTVLEQLAGHPDTWLRALALRGLREQSEREIQKWEGRARADPDSIVREAAGQPRAGGPTGLGGKVESSFQAVGTMERVLFLRQVPIFRNLTPEDLVQIARIASERVFAAGEYLCREGELGDELFVVAEGQVRVVKESDAGPRTLRIVKTGEQIGELAILCEQARSASVIAEGESVRVLVLRGAALQAILGDRPQVALAMLASLAHRLSTA